MTLQSFSKLDKLPTQNHTLGNYFNCDVSAFKSYDIRGIIGENMSAKLVYASAKAACKVLNAKFAAVGFDARASSPGYAKVVVKGLIDSGCNVINLGLCGTEEVYYACGSQSLDLGIMVTASHNPIDHNGLKFVGPCSQPLSEQKFQAIRDLVAAQKIVSSEHHGQYLKVNFDNRKSYIETVINIAGLSENTYNTAVIPRVVFNCGNGAAGPTLQDVLAELHARGVQIEAHVMNGAPDSTFPDGIPNPLLPENRAATAREVVRLGADLGVAFDGDFDRCFFFDSGGAFVNGEYVVALLAEATLRREAGAAIVHDPRVVFATRDKIRAAGGVATQVRTGHAFVKAKMRDFGAAYGGEMSAHHYFRDFFYCDSGMIPWMMILRHLAAEKKTLMECVSELRANYPSSGEINFQVDHKWEAVDQLRAAYASQATVVDETDGLSCDMASWRFNVRTSNTEDLLRLNVEARSEAVSVGDCVTELSRIISGVDRDR